VTSQIESSAAANETRAKRSTSVAESTTRVFGAILAAISILGIALASLGFGALLALSDFDVDPFEIMTGPSLLLAASALPIIELIGRFPPVDELLFRSLFLGLALTASVALAATFHLIRTRSSGRLRRFADITNCAINAATTSATRGLHAIGRSDLAWVLGLSSAAGVVGTTAAVLVAWLIPSIIIIISIGPVIGYKMSMDYHFKLAAEPVACTRPRTASERRTAWYAHRAAPHQPGGLRAIYTAACIEVRSRDFCERGRRVIATSDFVVLFDPTAGASRTLPRKDAVITSIESLSTGAPCKPLGS
jgi:hypothetical protein